MTSRTKRTVTLEPSGDGGVSKLSVFDRLGPGGPSRAPVLPPPAEIQRRVDNRSSEDLRGRVSRTSGEDLRDTDSKVFDYNSKQYWCYSNLREITVITTVRCTVYI